ncbi:MAG: cadherin-like domain-containing protein, partial [Chloroflexaceae bacterium]
VCDNTMPTNLCSTTTVTINVTDVNDVTPVITSTSFSVAENSPNGTQVGTLAVTDADGPATNFSVTGGTGQSLFNVNASSGKITVAGDLDYEVQSSYTLTVQVCDGGTPNLCSTATVTINVTDVNEVPVVDLNGAAPGVNYTAAYTEQAAPTTIVGPAAVVIDFDTTAPNNEIATLTATIAACEATESLSASSGTWDAATCTFTATGPPAPAAMSAVLQTLSYANSSDNPPASRTITVFATDNGTPPQTGPVSTITLNINAVDDPPTLANNGLTVGEGQSAAIAAAALQAVDPDTLPANLSFTLTALPAHGELRLNGAPLATGGSFTQANINAGELVYTHDGSETTSDSFSFTVGDGTTTLSAETFAITITPANDNPVLTLSPGAVAYSQGQPAVVLDPDAGLTDPDTSVFNGGALTVSLIGSAADDQLDIQNQGNGPGQVARVANQVRYGGVVIGSVSGGNGSTPLVVTFNSNATLTAVQAVVRAVTFANNATTLIDGDQRVATFIVSDGAGGNSAPVTKPINVNRIPTVANDTFQVIINTPRRLPVLANDSEPDGDSMTITAVSSPANGTAEIIESGAAVRYTPNTNYTGADSFTYTVSDGRGGTATATVTLTVERALVLLPYIHDRPVEPDLLVDFSVVPPQPGAFMPARVEVTVTNRGRGPASNFWVDFYINPREAPTVNQPWNELCRDQNCRGIAWFYQGVLRPGESVTFISRPQSADNPNGYQSQHTIWDGFFENGSYSLYAYVDSWNRDSSGVARDPRGAVAEENENNNRAERQLIVEVER